MFSRPLCFEVLIFNSCYLFFQIAFVSGLLLGNDQNTRSWFAVYARTSQKRKNDALQAVRDELLSQLQNILRKSPNSHLPNEYVIHGAEMLRLYSALRGIAGIK